MSRSTKVMSCSPEAVFDVLSDGWTYATWVVGAARIRRVDEGFPEPGAAVHHSVGAWPLLLSDVTEVEHVDPPHEIVLRAKTWPAGEALVRVSCQGTDGRTEVELEEYAVAGPAALGGASGRAARLERQPLGRADVPGLEPALAGRGGSVGDCSVRDSSGIHNTQRR